MPLQVCESHSKPARFVSSKLVRWLAWLLVVPTAVGCKPAGRTGAAIAPSSTSAGSAAQQRVATAPIKFSNVTANSGVDFSYVNGYEADNNTILEWLGGGVAVCDFDLDGSSDLFLAGGGGFDGKRVVGADCALYRSVDRWRYVDVSGPALGVQTPHYNHGCQAVDYDNDGFADLLLTGYGGVKLFHNEGDGTFLEAQREAELDDASWSTSAAWSDFNGDGALDLYLAHYVNWSFDNHPECRSGDKIDVCPPKRFDPLPDSLYISRGDGTFRNATKDAGLREDGKGLGVIAADLDQDTDIDIYVANDTTANFLYLNDGNGHFEEVGLLSGVSGDDVGDVNGSMGVDVGDFNRDGLLDVWVANYEQEPFALYRGYGGGQFQHVSKSTGINAFRGLFVGFGTAFVDLDLDGDEDLLVANGHVIKYPAASNFKQLPLVLLNSRSERFERFEFTGNEDYFAGLHLGRGLAVGDLDDDGDSDLVISHLREPVALLSNETPATGSWLRVRLVGRASNRDAIGAQLTLITSQGEQLRTICGGGSYLSQRDKRVSWGIPKNAEVRELAVLWPSGIKQRLSPVATNTTLTLHEPLPASDGL